MMSCFIHEMVPKMETWAKEIIAGTLEGEEASKAYSGIRLLTKYEPVNIYAPKRKIAEAVYASKKYFLDRI